MTAITQQLADALRACYREANDRTQPHENMRGAIITASSKALAAYDAQQAVSPGDGAWVAEPITNVVSAPPIRGRAYREPVASCNSAEYADRIVACVNAHDGLVAALREILAYCVESVPESPCHADLDTLGGKARDALTQTGVHHA